MPTPSTFDQIRSEFPEWSQLNDAELVNTVAKTIKLDPRQVAQDLGMQISKPGLGTDIKRGMGQMVGAMGSTARDLGAERVGRAMEGYGAGVAMRNPGEIHSVEDAISRPGTTIREAVGENVPQLGLSLGAGMVGRVAGGALGSLAGPAGTVAGQWLGAGAAGYLANLAQEYGGIRQEQREAGIEDKGRAAVAGGGAAALDTFLGVEGVANKIARKGLGSVAKEATKDGSTGFLKHVGKEVGKGAVVEGPLTEFPQTVMERWGAHKALTGSEAYNEYGLSTIKGAAGGGAFGGAMAPFTRPRTPNLDDKTQTTDLLKSDRPLGLDPNAQQTPLFAEETVGEHSPLFAPPQTDHTQAVAELDDAIARYTRLMAQAADDQDAPSFYQLQDVVSRLHEERAQYRLPTQDEGAATTDFSGQGDLFAPETPRTTLPSPAGVATAVPNFGAQEDAGTAAAPASKVFTPEEQAAIAVGLRPSKNALNLLAELQSQGLDLADHPELQQAAVGNKWGKVKQLLADALIAKAQAATAVATAQAAAPVPASTQVNTQAATPVQPAVQAPAPAPVAPAVTVTPAESQAPVAAEAPAAAAPAAALAPAEPVVRRTGKRVVTPAAPANVWVAPEPVAVADEEMSDADAWEDMRPEDAPAFDQLAAPLQEAWVKAGQVGKRSMDLAQEIHDENRRGDAGGDDVLETLKTIFGERDAAMLHDRYVGNMTEEQIANKTGLSRQAVAKVTGNGKLGRETRAARIAAAAKKHGWTEEYVRSLAGTLSEDPDSRPGEVVDDFGDDAAAEPTEPREESGDEFQRYDEHEDTHGNASYSDDGVERSGGTVASIGGAQSNWKDSDSDAQRAIELLDQVHDLRERIAQAEAAGKDSVSIGNKLVPLAELEARVNTLEAEARQALAEEERLLKEQAEKARAVAALDAKPEAKKPAATRVRKDASTQAPKAAPAAAPAQVLTATESAAKAWDQAVATIPGAPKWDAVPARLQREFVDYGEGNWTRQDVVTMLQKVPQNINGVIRAPSDPRPFDAELRALAHTDEREGDVLLDNMRYVSLEDAVRVAREARDAGALKAEWPAQYHFVLNVAMRDADRVMAAVLGPQTLKPDNAKALLSGPIQGPDGKVFTVKPTSLDLLQRASAGIARAVEIMRASGSAHLLDQVEAWYVSDDAGDWHGMYGNVDGRIVVIFNRQSLHDKGLMIQTTLHELGHVADHEEVFSSDGHFAPVVRELRREFDRGDSPMADILEYPFDLNFYSHLDGPTESSEAFAQAWFAWHIPALRQYIEQNLPVTAAYLHHAHAQAQAHSARQQARRSRQPGQVPAVAPGGRVATAAFRQAGAQGAAGQAVAQALTSAAGRTAQGWKEQALNKVVFTKDLVARAVKLGLAAAKDLQSVYEKRSALRGRLERGVEDTASLYYRLPQKEQGTGKGSANQFIYDVTRGGLWYRQPQGLKGWSQGTVQVDSTLAARYAQLSKEGKRFVDAVFEHGITMLAEKQQVVEEVTNAEYDARIAQAVADGDATKEAKLRAAKAAELRQFKSLLDQSGFKPYAPLKRFGPYVVVGKSQAYLDAQSANDRKAMAKLEKDEAHYFVDFAESLPQAIAAADKLKASGSYAEVAHKSKEAERQGLFGGTLSAFNEIRSEIDKLGGTSPAAGKLRELVSDLYLQALAEGSARKSELRRRSVAGNIDMLRSFASQGMADAQFVSSARYNGEADAAIQAMRRQREAGGERQAKSDVFNELMARHMRSFEFDGSPLADKLARVTSTWYLAFSPAYYLQNALQPLMLSLPYMTGRHGYAHALAQLLKGYGALKGMLDGVKLGERMNFDKAPADVQTMLKTLADRGLVDIGMEAELGRFQVDGDGAVGKALTRTQRFVRSVSTRVEAFNRVSTAVAAYRMELARTRDEAQATAYAAEVLEATHGDYSALNAPRAFNTGVGKVALQFKKYQLIQLTLLAKLIKGSGLSTPEQRAASKALAFTVGHAALVGGAVGLPGFKALAWAVGKIFGDDDEPEDAELALRRAVGDEWATLIARGVPAALGLDVSGSLGMGNALSILPFGDVDLTSKDGAVQTMAALMGGAAGSLLAKEADAIGLAMKGDYTRALAQALPNGISNIAKAYQEQTAGLTRRNGDVLVPAEDISALQSAATLLGLKTTAASERAWAAGVKVDYEQRLQDRAKAITAQYTRARRDEDADGVAQAREAWFELQAARMENGLDRQPLSTLLKAPMQQLKRERNTVGGIQFNRHDRRFVGELAGQE